MELRFKFNKKETVQLEKKSVFNLILRFTQCTVRKKKKR